MTALLHEDSWSLYPDKTFHFVTCQAYIEQKEWRYLRCLGAVYLRMTAHSPEEVFKVLEPLFADGRRVCMRQLDGSISMGHVDSFLWDLLTKRELLEDCSFYEFPARWQLEEQERVEVGGWSGGRRSLRGQLGLQERVEVDIK